MRSAEYRSMYREEGRHWWYVSLHELVLAYVPRDRPGQRILDAGCGTGRLLQLLQLRGTSEGCDASGIALFYCAQRGVNAARSDLNTVKLEQNSFDIITSIDVLYHRAIKNDGAVLQKFYAALKPGGRLILQVPAYEWLWSSHDEAVHTGRRYTRGRIERMLDPCGFEIEKSTYRVSLLFPLIVMFRLVRNMFRPHPGNGAVPSDVKEHAPLANTLYRAVMKAENRLVSWISFPFGTSVFIVARKPNTHRSGGESEERR